MLRWILIGVAAVLVLIQLVPVDRSNPPATEKLVMPDNVQQIMQRSCFDCHSNETVWPWYSYVAPVSWLVKHDVEEGREHLNFSEWDKLNQKRKMKRLEEIVEEVEEGKMPMPIYLIMHGDAEVSAAELAVLREWTQQELGNLGGADMGSSNDGEEAHEEEH
ncbi:MAG: heme-binding domain-containing protein [Calditrichae bacterium]|nr:heme-binding domain-containing protein [Calditrichia bacterium]